MKKICSTMLFLLGITLVIPTGCKKEEDMSSDMSTPDPESQATGERGTPAILCSSDVANAWMKLEVNIMATSSGIPNVAFSRPFAYSSVALYESVVNGMPAYQSLVGQLNGLPAMPQTNWILKYHWPSSANAAMASILKSMFPTISAANSVSIDSLENVFIAKYATQADAAAISRSIAFGKDVAQTVYYWSLTDGSVNTSVYAPHVGPGLWEPTPPAFGAASTPYWGSVRRMVPGSNTNAQLPAPMVYSEVVGSPFYNMAKHVYDASQTLTQAQTDMALFWRDIPGPTTPGHYLSILQQVLVSKNSSLAKAAVAYAACGITVFDAAVICWETKYTYNLVRPITYIRNVLGYSTWNSLLTTPGHPEYASAHATLSMANADVLEKLFGTNYSFTDHTNDYLGMAPRSFSSFRALGEDAGNSRVFGGIHYQQTIDISFTQGHTVAHNIIQNLNFKKW